MGRLIMWFLILRISKCDKRYLQYIRVYFDFLGGHVLPNFDISGRVFLIGKLRDAKICHPEILKAILFGVFV